jgi:hypothetical protein
MNLINLFFYNKKVVSEENLENKPSQIEEIISKNELK